MLDFLQQPANLVLYKTLGKLFFLSVIGYLSVRSHLLSAGTIECLSRFVIAVALPCLIISTLARELSYDLLGKMAHCLVAAIILNGLGLAAALATRRFFLPPALQGRGLFLSLASIQNSGYLPIPLTIAVLPGSQSSMGMLYVFIYIFVMGFIFWSLGVWLISGSAGRGCGGSLRKVVNPPMVAMLVGLLFLIPRLKAGYAALAPLPEVLLMAGKTTIPLVLIILGGSFAGISLAKPARLVVGLAAALKLFIIPAAALLTAVFLRLDQLFAFILVLQAAMPAAMNHIVVVQEYGGDVALTSHALFVQYLLSLVTVPFFLLLFNALYLS